MQVTDEMVEKAKVSLSHVRYGLSDTELRIALTAALSDQERAVEVKEEDAGLGLQTVSSDDLQEAVALLQSVMRPSMSARIITALNEQASIIERFKRTSRARRLSFEAARSALVDVPAVEPVAWREIEGYQGLYEVSSGGDVRSIQTGRLLAKNLAGSGYVKADLWKNGKRWQTTVHRLVADAFLEKQGSEINHINGVKTDNRVENLEWCTRSENVSHSFYVLSKRVRPVEAYNPETGEKRHYRSVCEAARDGFRSSQIYRALKNPNRSVKGFRWREASPPLSREGEDSAETIAWRVLDALRAADLGDLLRASDEVALPTIARALAATRSASASEASGKDF